MLLLGLVSSNMPVLDSGVIDERPCLKSLKMTLRKARRIRTYRGVVLNCCRGALQLRKSTLYLCQGKA